MPLLPCRSQLAQVAEKLPKGLKEKYEALLTDGIDKHGAIIDLEQKQVHCTVQYGSAIRYGIAIRY
jgi:hypothetical protein